MIPPEDVPFEAAPVRQAGLGGDVAAEQVAHSLDVACLPRLLYREHVGGVQIAGHLLAQRRLLLTQHRFPRRVAIGPDPLCCADGQAGHQRHDHARQQHGNGLVPSAPTEEPPSQGYPPRPNRLVGEESPQIFTQFVGRLVTALGVLVDRLQDDRLQVARNARVEGAGRRASSVLICSMSLSRSRESKAGRSVSSS